MTFARAVRASNGIEGFNASLDDVAAVLDGEAPLDADLETRHALAGYRDAMTYVLQLARDADGRIDEGQLKALHFHDAAARPQSEPGPVASGPGLGASRGDR